MWFLMLFEIMYYLFLFGIKQSFVVSFCKYIAFLGGGGKVTKLLGTILKLGANILYQ